MCIKEPGEKNRLPNNLCTLSLYVLEMMRKRRGSLAEGVAAKTSAVTVCNHPHEGRE